MFTSVDHKQRFSDNPNGLAWSKDESKFGQKMLEKMGWKKGKGLGAKEDGRTEHVKVSLKTDKKGVGCAVKHTDKWLDRLDEYEALLAQFNNSEDMTSESQDSGKTNEKGEFQALAKKSETVKNRVHYSRFTKGKDLSLKSEKDLDCVFGRRGKQEEDSRSSSESEEPSTVEAEHKQQFGVVTTTSSTNLQDYFAQKMAALRRSKSDTQLSDMCKNKEDDSNQDSMGLLGTTESVAENEVIYERVSSKKSKKKKKREKEDEKNGTVVLDECKVKEPPESEDVLCFSETRLIEDTQTDLLPGCKKTKKRKLKKETEVIPEILEDTECSKPKKRKRSKEIEETQDIPLENKECRKSKKHKANKETEEAERNVNENCARTKKQRKQ